MNLLEKGQVAVAQGFFLLCPKTEHAFKSLIFRRFARQQRHFGAFSGKIRHTVLSSGISVSNQVRKSTLSTPRERFFAKDSR
jgi:hypothetical protein